MTFKMHVWTNATDAQWAVYCVRISMSQKCLSGPDLVKDCDMSGQYGLQLVCLLEQVLARLWWWHTSSP